ncbi:hypothetical protein FWD07_02145 [Candidatus Saccharibacteria bacterium]|nr:hypothetical protein [Candidatus Saccharibacteria bacterium]
MRINDYSISVQAKEIKEMSARTEPFETNLAGVNVTVLPKVYPGGVDSELTSKAIGDMVNMIHVNSPKHGCK